MSRSTWKGPFINPKDLKTLSETKNKHTILTLSRNSEITPKFIGLIVKISNGKSYSEINITEDMVGHKFGEFAPTRAKFSFKKKSKK